jgi:hypothetical protein
MAKETEISQANVPNNESPTINWGQNIKRKENYKEPNSFYNLTVRKDNESNETETTCLTDDEKEFFDYLRNTEDEVQKAQSYLPPM